MSHLYPIMLDLKNRTCVIVGGGKVAARKTNSLVDTGAQITVISPVLDRALIDLRDAHKISVQQVAYTSGMLITLKPFLVFAATDDDAVNQQIVEEARSLDLLVNSVNAHGEHDFINMATIQRGDITVAVSSSGASPALVAHLKDQINNFIGEEYITISIWMGQARPSVQGGIKSQPERAALWRRVIESSILDKLRQGDSTSAQQLFDQIIREALESST